MADEPTAGAFLIDGEAYPFPDLAEMFTLDEAMVFFDYTGFPIEDMLIDVDDLESDDRAEYETKARNPRVLAALMHLAYKRKHPKATETTIKRTIRDVDFVALLTGLVGGDEESPPAETATPETGSSPPSSDSSEPSSGVDSTPSSATLAVVPATTGTSGLGTSATSGRMEQAG